MRGFALQQPEGISSGSLPRDLQEAAVSRLAFASIVAMLLAATALAVSFLRQPNIGARAGMERPVWLIPLWFGVSLAMWLAVRSKRLTMERKLTAGIGYLVATCAGFALFRHALIYLPEDVLRGFSPVSACTPWRWICRASAPPAFLAARVPSGPSRGWSAR